MKHYQIVLWVKIITLSILLPSRPVFPAEKKWQDKMHELAGTIGDLLPELFTKKMDAKKIEVGAKKLSEMAHGLNLNKTGKMKMDLPDSDPTIIFFATLFEQQTKRAYWAAKEGNTEYARNVLRSVTGYCIACHTRHDKGPDFLVFPLNPKTNKLGKMEKAELLSATRQFDKALAEFQGIVTDTHFAKDRHFDWDRAIRNALVLSVRVKKDPVSALKTVDSVLKINGIPEHVSDTAKKWKQSLVEWQTEPTRKETMTEEELFDETSRLLEQARAKQKYPMDHSGDILYLRASARAHELLGLVTTDDKMAAALFLAGNAYEVMYGTTAIPLHEMYYEACTRKIPHTTLSQECYRRYEEATYAGYSGSGGMRIPFEVERSLQELKEISSEKVK